MTNLQAIDLLKGLEQSLDDYCELNDEGKTAFGMAITALELFGNSEQLSSAQPDHQWTPSGKKPPEKGRYLVWMPFAPPERRITVAEYCGGYWNIKTPISAWMPLPEPMREDGAE